MKNYILIITIHADPAMPPGYGEWGGTHTYMRELLDDLDKNGVDCILITRRALQELPSIEQYRPHCKIYRLENGPIAPIDKTLLQNYHNENLDAISKIIEEQEAPPLAIHSVYWNSGRLGMALSKNYHIPFVHSVISNSRGRTARGAIEPVPARAGYEQAIYDAANWILCVSEDEKKDLIQFYHIDTKKLIVAGQYIHPSFISPARSENGFPRLNSSISHEEQNSVATRYSESSSTKTTDLFWTQSAFTYFGRIHEDKGVDHILAAWRHVFYRNQEDCPALWLIGGSISEIEKMRTMIARRIPALAALEQMGKIVWWGCLDPEGASTLLLKTRALVTNSLYEPGGRVVVEAMSEGIPVIAAPNGFARDLILDWQNGFLIEHGDEDGLARCMEYFIRQPFLSNALGLNAKQTAANVIQRWGFLQKHMWAYGLLEQCDPEILKPCVNYFERREIHLFPYENLPISERLLAHFFTEQTGENILSGPTRLNVQSASDLYHIKGERGNYIIKHPFTRLAVGPLCCPIQNWRYVRNAAEHYRFEKAAYSVQRDSILIGSDDFHQLLLLQELQPYQLKESDLPAFAAFLSEQAASLSKEQTALYLGSIQKSSLKTTMEIETLLEKLSALFPDYYFEASGLFLSYIGWRIAPHLLAYNEEWISAAYMGRLRTIMQGFSSVSKLPATDFLREINTDTELRHIHQMHGKWRMVDRENRSIGMVESEIADLLVDMFLQSDEPAFTFWPDIIEQSVSTVYDRSEIISSAAYRLFYDAVLYIVMRRGPVERFLSTLEFLADYQARI